MVNPMPFRLYVNPQAGTPKEVVLAEAGFRAAQATICAWPGYAPTPLRDLPAIARSAKLGAVWLKDESSRFGLGSFKALGAAYAISRLLGAELTRRGVTARADIAGLLSGQFRDVTASITLACATDGNHGRAVAWAARNLYCRCVVFLHPGVSEAREAAIAAEGARIRKVSGTYDDAVRETQRVAANDGWFVVSDTSSPGHEETARDIMQGYRVMVEEALAQWEDLAPTHVFVQAGVGGAAAAVSAHLRARLQPRAQLIIVESEHAACLLDSAEAGEIVRVPGDLETIMAGLACGEPSFLAWQELEHGAAAFLAIPDDAARDSMRIMARQGITLGESGVAGLAGLLLAASDPATQEMLSLNTNSRVLLFGTEGATDPESYARLVGGTTKD
jgi:diaminopropionate ammonia-lyase